jgi:hypothetical protein
MNSMDFLVGPDGILERPVSSTTWDRVEGVEVARRFLRFRKTMHLRDEMKWGDYAALNPQIGPGRGMLEQFVCLNADVRKIIAFATKWGPLSIKRTREAKGDPRLLPLPAIGSVPTRNSIRRNWEFEQVWRHQGDWKRRPNDDLFDVEAYEPLYVWRYWSGIMAAALRVGSRLAEGERPSTQDWQRILGVTRFANYDFQADERRNEDFKPEHREGTERPAITPSWWVWHICSPEYVSFEVPVARTFFFDTLTEWQNIGEVDLHLDPWRNTLIIRTPCLFSGLVWQLMAAVVHSGGMAICSGCTKLYPRKRKPSAARRNYCPACKAKNVQCRDAMRDLRHRQRMRETAK